ncbi:MAG: hypothetical protein J5956_08370 [Ruminococcus sp.]|nr:hypothetical protein [Ruminococcus sp.]MBP3267277.1 hypothetical protein [Ruminococcus sp.]
MTKTNKKSKNTRKLLGAVGMLTVSAAMLVSSTFAWFSLNKKVTASTMNVQAKSYNPYLLINEVEGDTTNKYDISATLMDASDTAVKLKLVNPKTIAANMVWQEATAKRPDNYEKNTAGFHDVALSANATNEHILEKTNSTENEDYYVLTYDLYFKTSNDTQATNLRLALQSAAGTEADPKGVSVTGVSAGKLEEAARVLFVNQADGAYALYDAGTDAITYSKNSGTLADTVTNTDGSVHLKVYMYFDGEDDKAFTNNAVDLQSIVGTFNFVVDGTE